jgi:hypothetical protein
MERGGCRIETASNQIDAATSDRWQRIAASLGKESDNGWHDDHELGQAGERWRAYLRDCSANC